MPSIEIVCLDQTDPLEFADFPFPVVADRSLVSHRSPTTIFQKDFSELSGCLYHLLGAPRHCEAYELLKRNWHDEAGNSNGRDLNVEFRDDIKPFVKRLLHDLVSASPVRKLLFTSDYQFGPDEVKRFGTVTLEKFWELHDRGELRINASYEIVAS